MGQKVNPYGLRLGINKGWKSKWFVDPKEYANVLHQDLALRKVIAESPETQTADVADVEIIRHPQRVTVIIRSSGFPSTAYMERCDGRRRKCFPTST